MDSTPPRVFHSIDSLDSVNAAYFKQYEYGV